MFEMRLSQEARSSLEDEVRNAMYSNRDSTGYSDEFDFYGAASDIVNLFEKKLLEAREGTA